MSVAAINSEARDELRAAQVLRGVLLARAALAVRKAGGVRTPSRALRVVHLLVAVVAAREKQLQAHLRVARIYQRGAHAVGVAQREAVVVRRRVFVRLVRGGQRLAVALVEGKPRGRSTEVHVVDVIGELEPGVIAHAGQQRVVVADDAVEREVAAGRRERREVKGRARGTVGPAAVGEVLGRLGAVTAELREHEQRCGPAVDHWQLLSGPVQAPSQGTAQGHGSSVLGGGLPAFVSFCLWINMILWYGAERGAER